VAHPWRPGRPEILPFVPDHAQRVLDVGCDDGRFAAHLRRASPGRVIWGIDLKAGDAAPYDRRIRGRYPDDLPAVEPFDCVVFNDVLEHNVDPGAILRATVPLIHTTGTVVASIPNIRDFRVVVPLVVKGRFDYRDFGILDRTHLRFFTRATMRELFEGNGYVVSHQEPINISEDGKRGLINRLSGRRLTEFVAQQYVTVAHPAHNYYPAETRRRAQQHRSV
jgi:hypothetical protein